MKQTGALSYASIMTKKVIPSRRTDILDAIDENYRQRQVLKAMQRTMNISQILLERESEGRGYIFRQYMVIPPQLQESWRIAAEMTEFEVVNEDWENR